MWTIHSPSVLCDPRTDAFEHTKFLCRLTKVLQALEVGVIYVTVILNRKCSVRLCASCPLTYATLNLSHDVSDHQPSSKHRKQHLQLSALTQGQAEGMV